MSKCIKCGSYAFNLYKEEIDQGGLCDVHYWQGRAHRAEALAEPPAQQEPVAWGKPTDEMVQAATDEYDEWANENKGTTECIRAMLSKALKASPQANANAGKPWVELDHDDIHALMNEFFYPGRQPFGAHFANFAKAIEAKLKEKNNGHY